MKVVIQRVSEAKVVVDNSLVSKIDNGYLILVSFCNGDTYDNIVKMASKIVRLRIFSDEAGKMNLDIKKVNGSILSISQFTLYANTNDGNRPSFTDSLKYDQAEKMYKIFNEELRKYDVEVKEGIFGADMKVSLLNDGPVTIIMEN